MLLTDLHNSELCTMHNVTGRLNWDCEAVQIPAGTTTTLKAGTLVDITQSLGGTYTLHVHGGLYRLSAKDADALGLDKTPTEPPAGEAAKDGPKGPADEAQVWEALKT